MRIASALTNPTITCWGMNRMSRANPTRPSTTCNAPARITVAMRYSTPWLATSGAMTSATAPVAAEIIAGRPPTIAIVTAIVKEANSPSRGSTPAMMENAMASGMSASATTSPPSTSVFSNVGVRSTERTDWRSSAEYVAALDGMTPILPRQGLTQDQHQHVRGWPAPLVRLGGGWGIRTPGGFPQRFSRPPQSAALSTLQQKILTYVAALCLTRTPRAP